MSSLGIHGVGPGSVSGGAAVTVADLGMFGIPGLLTGAPAAVGVVGDLGIHGIPGLVTGGSVVIVTPPVVPEVVAWEPRFTAWEDVYAVNPLSYAPDLATLNDLSDDELLVLAALVSEA